MGIEYYLVKERSKEYFELAKGNWGMVFSNTEKSIPFCFSRNEQELYIKFLEKVAVTFSDDTDLGYFKRLANRVFLWAGDSLVQLKSSSYWEDRKNYIQTRSRFDPDIVNNQK